DRVAGGVDLEAEVSGEVLEEGLPLAAFDDAWHPGPVAGEFFRPHAARLRERVTQADDDVAGLQPGVGPSQARVELAWHVPQVGVAGVDLAGEQRLARARR